MEKQVSRTNHRSFINSDNLFEGIDAVSASNLAAIGADITLVIDDQGIVRDVAYKDPALEAYHLDKWRGKQWHSTVTPECHDKIQRLLDENNKERTTKKRQVNHAANGLPDLPVDYVLVSLEGRSIRLALGTDLRPMATIQRKLVQMQMEMETEYAKVREAESRYRTIFHKTSQPIIVVDGESGNVLDINLTCSNLISQPADRVVNKSVTALFERQYRTEITEAMNAARHGGTLKTINTKMASGESEIAIAIEPYRENGRGNVIISILQTDTHNASHQNSAPSEHSLLDSIPEALVTIDLKGNILETNDQFLDLVHVVNKNHLLDRNLNNWLGGSAVDLQVLLTRIKEESSLRQFATIVRDELGTSKHVNVSAARYVTNGQTRVGIFISETGRRENQITVPSPGGNNDSSDFAELVGRVPLKDLIREAVDVIEKMCIEAALKQTDNNRASAADMLGLSRQSLYIKLRRHSLEDFGNE